MNTDHASLSNYGSVPQDNILIDQGGHACLADFGFLTVVSGLTNQTVSSTYVAGGTIGWMSPELLISVQRPTKQSDCYALGMVIYEVLTGQSPFAPFGCYAVLRKVTDGEHPERPEGVEGERFTNDLWRTLDQCWATQPESRPSSSAVLECLERISRNIKPSSLAADEHFGVGGAVWNLAKCVFRAFSWFDPRFFIALLRRILF